MSAPPASVAPAPRRRPWLVPVAVLVAVLAALELAGAVAGSGPSGPTSSSYATASDGLAAWAELAQRAGHLVVQLRQPIATARIDPGSTLVVLDPDQLLHGAGLRLRAFVGAGGRLLIGGSNPEAFLTALYPNPPDWDTTTSTGATPTAAGTRSLPGVARVRTAANGAWATGEAGTPLIAYPDGESLVLARRDGRGEILLVADASPLQNQLLAQADNAQLALELAGPPSRPLVFAESVHGYGPSTGLAALPTGWKIALAGLLLAGLLWIVARGRRLGPPDPLGPPVPPPRTAYVRALALSLRRVGRPGELAEPLRRAADAELGRRTGLAASASPQQRRAALVRLGLDDVQVQALDYAPGPSWGDDTRARVLALAGAVARLRTRRPT